RHGLDGFLAPAASIATTVQSAGGVLTVADLHGYRPVWREPLEGQFHGRRILAFPPPGSGGVVLEALGILGGDDLTALGPGPRAHLVAAAMAQAFTDRATWYGDTRVPVRTLLDAGRLRALRASIPMDRVPTTTAALVIDAGTAHVSVVDGDGNAIA